MKDKFLREASRIDILLNFAQNPQNRIIYEKIAYSFCLQSHDHYDGRFPG
jgi:hypothetical protein